MSVVVADRKIAADVAGVDAPERSRDDCRGSIGQCDRAISAGDGHPALNVTGGDASETIAYLKGAFHVRHLHGTVVVAHGDISAGPHEFNAAKRIVPAAGARVTDIQRTVAILHVCSSVNTCYLHAAETVSHRNRRVGRHPTVITDGPRRVLAGVKPSLFLFGINRLDVYPLASLLHFDFDFLREGFRFLMRT